MATLDDVTAMAGELPGVHEGERHGQRTWFVGKRAFAWERGWSKADLRRFAQTDPPTEPPKGPILAVAVEDLAEKEAVLAAGQRGFFTIEHFHGYAAVLISLPAVGKRHLRAAVLDAWLTCAPPQVAEEHLRSSRPSRRRR